MILNINNKLNITLCGMMGSGKSTIGRILAKKTNLKFIDIDKLIEEKANKSINDIFLEDGEKNFRNLEEIITNQMLKKNKTIVALGGGAMDNENTRNCINEYSYNIYLKASYNVLKKRLINSKNRPLIKKNNLDKVLTNLIQKREKFYNKADLIVKNEKNIDKTVEDILKILKNV